MHLRFTGQPLALVTGFDLERLRGGTYGALWVASMPAETSRETCDVRLKVNLGVAHISPGSAVQAH